MISNRVFRTIIPFMVVEMLIISSFAQSFKGFGFDYNPDYLTEDDDTTKAYIKGNLLCF